MTVLVITSAVNVSTYKQTKLINMQDRKNLTKEAINYILEQKIVSKILLVDGTNELIFSKQEIVEIENKGVIIEQLAFQQNSNDVRRYGKSNGELQIMNFAVEYSDLLKSNSTFFKLSARYKIVNIKQIMQKLEGVDNVFFFDNLSFIPKKYKYTSTIFYKTTVEFYQENFSEALYRCSNEPEGYLESVYYNILAGRKKRSMYVQFPYYEGIAGTTASAIKNRRYIIKNLLSQVGLLSFRF